MSRQASLRQATRGDYADLHRVRMAVRENRLRDPGRITEDDYADALENTGRGWVVENAAGIVAFAIGNVLTGNIWALFVDPRHEGLGYGRWLHDAMVQWLRSRGLQRLWLTTTPGTRAAGFYRALGWRDCGMCGDELRLELELDRTGAAQASE